MAGQEYVFLGWRNGTPRFDIPKNEAPSRAFREATTRMTPSGHDSFVYQGQKTQAGDKFSVKDAS